MKRTWVARWIGALSPALWIAACFAAQPPRLPEVVDLVHGEFREQEALDFVREVWENDRWFTSGRFQATARYLAGELHRLGASEVEIIRAPADGFTQAGFWTLPKAWDVERARLEIVSPAVLPPDRLLADYSSVPQSLCNCSGGAPEGLESELAEWDPSLAGDGRFKGKFVLTSREPSGFKWALIQAGVAGVVNTFTHNPDLVDGVHWVAAWGDYGWPFLDTSTPLPCFSISPSQASRLRGLLSEGPVRLRATVDVTHYSGELVYVTGVIPGSEPGQELLLLGHTGEPGAQDNATGVAAMLESAAVLQRLIRSGRLPQPRRSIRILAMPELFGSMHYVQSHPDRVRRTVAAMCLDTPAGDYDAANTEYTFYLPPWVASSFTEAWLVRTAETYFSRHSRQRKWRTRPFVSGTDNFLSDPMIGVPTIFPYSGTGVRTYHNSEDTPDDVDVRSLRDIVSVAASWAYSLASARDEDLVLMAQAAAGRGMDGIAHAALDASDRAGTREHGRLRFIADLRKQAVRSVLPLADQPVGTELLEAVETLNRSLEAFAEIQVNLLSLQSEETPGMPAAAGPFPNVRADRSEAERMVVRRKRFGTIPFDRIPPDRREGFSPGLFEGPAVIALWWCDGRRPLSEVIRFTEYELGASEFDFVGYFRFLQRHGFVDIVTVGESGQDADLAR